MPQAPERFRQLTDHGVIPSPSGAGALLMHAEEGLDCLVVLGVFRPADKARLTAIVTFEGCMQSVFGYPNDEAYWHDPRGAAGDEPGYGAPRLPGPHAGPLRGLPPLLHRLSRPIRRIPRRGHEDRGDRRQLRGSGRSGAPAGLRHRRRGVRLSGVGQLTRMVGVMRVSAT
jgi:hypothetical protein